MNFFVFCVVREYVIVVVKVVVVRVEEKKENTREDFSHSLESLLAEIGEKREK